jgi:hypothetical protein
MTDLPADFNGLESQEMRDVFLEMRKFLQNPGDSDATYALMTAAMVALEEYYTANPVDGWDANKAVANAVYSRYGTDIEYPPDYSGTVEKMIELETNLLRGEP